VTRLFREYPSVMLLAVLGIVALIAYLAVRGRRLGALDLFVFALLALSFDGLVVAIYAMWEQNSPLNLFVLIALLFAVPVAAFFTLGTALVALRLVHIGLTGGREPKPPRRAASGRGGKENRPLQR
jgi:hypothetical protein